MKRQGGVPELHRGPFLLAASAASLLAGCAALGPKPLDDTERQWVADFSRSVALAPLTDQEKTEIASRQPKIGYYRMGGTFTQFMVSWSLSTGRSFNLNLEGDVMSHHMYVNGVSIEKER